MNRWEVFRGGNRWVRCMPAGAEGRSAEMLGRNVSIANSTSSVSMAGVPSKHRSSGRIWREE